MSTRLSKADWLEHGLTTLGSAGAAGLKADVMAKSLNVSRGSFYWHFKDIAHFKNELLTHWEIHSTERVINVVDSDPQDENRLLGLIVRAFQADEHLEPAIREWADRDEVAAEVVARIDARREEFIRALLLKSGLPLQKAGPRAAFLYWAYLGRTLSRGTKRISMSEMADIAKFLVKE